MPPSASWMSCWTRVPDGPRDRLGGRGRRWCSPPARTITPTVAFADTAATTAAPPKWTAGLRCAYWVTESVLRLEGWAFVRGRPEPVDPDAGWRLWLDGRLPRDDARCIPAAIRGMASEDVNAVVGDARHDRCSSGFVADIDLRSITDTAPASVFTSSWTIVLSRSMNGSVVTGRVTGRDRTASVPVIESRVIDGCLCRADWTDESGLSLTVARRAATLVSASTTSNEASARVRVVDVVATGVVFSPVGRAVEDAPGGGRSAFLPVDAAGAVAIRVPIGERRDRAGAGIPLAGTPPPGRWWDWATAARSWGGGERADLAGRSRSTSRSSLPFAGVRLLKWGLPGVRVESVTVLVGGAAAGSNRALGRKSGAKFERRRSG